MSDELAQGHKDDSGKARLDLISPYFLSGVGGVLTFGAEKYAPYNWAKGIVYSRVFSALQRHLWAWWNGEQDDPETGAHHLYHAGCCLMFLAHYEAMGGVYRAYDDRPVYPELALERGPTDE